MSSTVPEGWKKVTVSDSLNHFQNGYAFSSSGYKESGVPIISIVNISLDGKFKFDVSKEKKWSSSDLDKLQRYWVKNNDLIIAMTDVTPNMAMIGRGAVVNRKSISLLNQRVGLLKPKDSVLSKYLAYIFNGDQWRKSAQLSASLGAQANLGTAEILKMKVLLPPFPEQKKIASILTSVDEVIENTQKQIDKLQDLKKATMNELLTKGIGHTEFKDSELGQIPKEWKIFTLGELTKISSSNVDKKIREEDQKVKLCNYMDVYSNNYIRGYLDFMDSTASVKEVEKFIVKKGNIIITKDSESPDDIAVPALVVDDIENLICGYHLYLITTKKVLDAGYLMNYLLLDSTKISIGKVAQGSTRFGINLSEVKSLNIPLPSLSEQKSISTKIFSKDNLIESNKNILEKYKSLKKSLMQDLLTGKVRVSVN